MKYTEKTGKLILALVVVTIKSSLPVWFEYHCSAKILAKTFVNSEENQPHSTLTANHNLKKDNNFTLVILKLPETRVLTFSRHYYHVTFPKQLRS